jgi:hypothetical protein
MTKKAIANMKAEADKVITMTEAQFFDIYHGTMMIAKHGEMKFNGFVTWTGKDGVKIFAEKSGEYLTTYAELQAKAVAWHTARGHYDKLPA